MSHETGGFMKNLLILLTALFLASCATQSTTSKSESQETKVSSAYERDWVVGRLDR
jgi:uncharacterized lipoprotein YajG